MATARFLHTQKQDGTACVISFLSNDQYPNVVRHVGRYTSFGELPARVVKENVPG